MIKIYFNIKTLISVLFSLVSTLSYSQNQVNTFQVESEINKPATALNLSTIIKDVKYIRLETKSNTLIGANNVQVLSIGEYLFISQGDQPLHIFNNKGVYLRTIGQFGRGPNEYNQNYSYTIDYQSQEIFILKKNTGKILSFDFNGNPKNSIELTNRILQFALVKNDLFCACIVNEGMENKEDFNYVCFNKKGDILEGFHIPGSAYREFKIDGNSYPYGTILTPIFSNSPDGINIITQQNDSIFSVNKNGILFPGLILDFGKYKPPFFPLDPRVAESEKVNYIRSFGVVETLNEWYVGFSLNNQFHKFIINKATNTSMKIEVINNDFDGGPNFWPFFVTNNGQSFAFPQTPIYLKRSLAEKKFYQTNIKYPSKNSDLIDLINSLDISDNPVIMLVELL